MDDLFPLIFVIIGIVGSLVSSAKKEKDRKTAEEHRRAAAAARLRMKPQPAAKPAPHPYAAASAEPATFPVMAFGDIPGQITPTVHPHIQPDCDTHDAPGSLGVTSMEGKDPCHEDQLTLERTFAEKSEPTGNLSFDWTGDSMVKAVVMQEVLTRPMARRAR